MDKKMIAACGLDCAACPALLAWKNDDQALRVKTAAEWKQNYHFDFTPEMINCSGCKAEGPKIGHCGECKMRICSTAKGHSTCASCPDFAACADIQGFIGGVPDAKRNLEGLKA